MVAKKFTFIFYHTANITILIHATFKKYIEKTQLCFRASYQMTIKSVAMVTKYTADNKHLHWYGWGETVKTVRDIKRSRTKGLC